MNGRTITLIWNNNFDLEQCRHSVTKFGEVMMVLDLHRQGLSISAIAKDLGIDRKTVRRILPTLPVQLVFSNAIPLANAASWLPCTPAEC